MPNIWQDPTKSIPKNDSRIDRIDFDKEDMGARKSHIRNVHHKNSNQIEHVSTK